MVEGTIYLLRYSIFWNAFAVIFLIYDDWILCNLRVIFFKAWLSIFKFGSTFIIKRSTVINVCAFFFFFLYSWLPRRRSTFLFRKDEGRRLNLVTDTWQFLINFRTKWNRLLQFRNLISDKEYLKLGEIDIPQVGCSAFAVQLKKDWLIKNYTE